MCVCVCLFVCLFLDPIGINEILGISKGPCNNTNMLLNTSVNGHHPANDTFTTTTMANGLPYTPLTPNSSQSAISPDTLSKSKNFDLFQVSS